MNSDGLPLFLVRAAEDKVIMAELKAEVFAFLDANEIRTAKELIASTDIHPFFIDEVEEFIEEWQGA
jgi:hypothetical protein